MALVADTGGYGWAMALYCDGRLAEARAALDALIDLGTVSAEIYNLRGVVLQDLGDQRAALGDFEAALQLDPSSVEARVNRALACISLDEHEQAEADLREAVRLAPASGLAQYHLGLFLIMVDRYEDAIAQLEQATQLVPDDGDIWFQLGVACDRAGRAERAIEAFSRTIILEGGMDSTAHFLRGLAWLDIGTPEACARAVADFSQAMEQGLTTPNVSFYRGLALYNQSLFQQAISEFLRTIEADPAYDDARRYLALARRALAGRSWVSPARRRRKPAVRGEP